MPGRLLLPPEPRGPAPVILLQHGTGGSKESPYLDAAVRWVHAGAAVASIDFPLHGERTSAKLSEQFFSSLAPGSWDDKNGMTEIGKALWIDFARQAVTDLRRSVDALATLDEIDETRVAFGGFSLGAIVGTLFCSVEERIRGAALALAGGGFGPTEIDPCNAIAAIAPRPVLFLNALQGPARTSNRHPTPLRSGPRTQAHRVVRGWASKPSRHRHEEHVELLSRSPRTAEAPIELALRVELRQAASSQFSRPAPAAGPSLRTFFLPYRLPDSNAVPALYWKVAG